MSYDILSRWTSAVIYHSETATTVADAVVEARRKGADLGGANLVRADLVGADLVGADLVRADLGGADLVRADLGGADLGRAYLVRADLGGANLGGANLGRANLVGANLGGAYLGGAKGLLSKPVPPLQLLGSRHTIICRQDGYLTIGCMHHPLTWWEEHYRAVGRKEQYTDQQIQEYGEHIAHFRRWMEQYGVLEVIDAVA